MILTQTLIKHGHNNGFDDTPFYNPKWDKDMALVVSVIHYFPAKGQSHAMFVSCDLWVVAVLAVIHTWSYMPRSNASTLIQLLRVCLISDILMGPGK